MKHLKRFNENINGLSKEEYDVLCMISDVQNDGEKGVSAESLDDIEYKVVIQLEEKGLVKSLSQGHYDLYIITKEGERHL